MTMIATKEPQFTTAVQDGVLNVCKEGGWTSHDVVARIRGKLRGMKVGHAGTLDPAGGRAAGSVSVTTRPPSSRGTARASPPCARATARTIDSPTLVTGHHGLAGAEQARIAATGTPARSR